MSEKLQKVLARAGVGSRRHMEQAILEGRVSVNGALATLGDRVEMGDQVRIDGRLVPVVAEEEMRRRVIMYYKPEGEICTRSDPEGRPTVFERLPPLQNERWILVGRLDVSSSGLLLLTTDGELANRLMHPSSGIQREYAVRILGEVADPVKDQLMEGIMLEDGVAKFDALTLVGGEGANKWYQVTLREGRNREVRRMFEAVGLVVSRLIRIRYGSIQLPKHLRTGRWLELDKEEIDTLAAEVELKPRRGTGLYGLQKRRTEKMRENPLPPRRGGFLRQQRRDNDTFDN